MSFIHSLHKNSSKIMKKKTLKFTKKRFILLIQLANIAIESIRYFIFSFQLSIFWVFEIFFYKNNQQSSFPEFFLKLLQETVIFSSKNERNLKLISLSKKKILFSSFFLWISDKSNLLKKKIEMEEEFMILDAHQYAQSTNRSKNNIIFRIQWKKTGQIAFMHYEIAKRKCPQMLIEYFTARLMPVSMDQQCSNSCSSVIEQASSFSPFVKNGERLTGKQKNQVQAYFNRCEKCKFQQKKFIDYDEYLQHAEPQRMSVFFKRQVLSSSSSDKN